MGKSSKSQVRQTDQVWFHCQLQASSLAGDLQWHSCVDHVGPLLVKRLEKPLETGCDTHNKPNSARMQISGKPDLFSKTACALAGHALFGRKVGPALGEVNL